MNHIIGPDNLDMGPANSRCKLRWVAKLFKDAHQVHNAEFLRGWPRPPLTISATADKSWCDGGEMLITFNRTEIEIFDEMWLALYDGEGQIIEEWELQKVKKVFRLYTSHLLGEEELPQDQWAWDNEGEKTIKISFESMMYRCNVKMGFGDKNVGKWTNWSDL